MRIKIFHWITRLLVLVMFAGTLPINTTTFQLAAQEQDKKKKKKKPSKKKKSSKKKKPSKKKKSSKKKKPSKKKKSSKKKKPAKKKSSKKSKPAARKKVAATPVPKKEISVIQLTRELFDYTNKMKTSSRRLAHATRYLVAPQKKAVAHIESKAKYTTRDYEEAAEKAQAAADAEAD